MSRANTSESVTGSIPSVGVSIFCNLFVLFYLVVSIIAQICLKVNTLMLYFGCIFDYRKRFMIVYMVRDYKKRNK